MSVCARFHAEGRIFTIDAILAMAWMYRMTSVKVQRMTAKLVTWNERRDTLGQHDSVMTHDDLT